MRPDTSGKAPKKTGKIKNNSKINKKKKPKRKDSYGRYVYKVLQQVHPGLEISNKAMGIMNDMLKDIFENIAAEAFRLARCVKHKTITSRDIAAAAQLLLPGELRKQAVSVATAAVTKYTTSK